MNHPENKLNDMDPCNRPNDLVWTGNHIRRALTGISILGWNINRKALAKNPASFVYHCPVMKYISWTSYDKVILFFYFASHPIFCFTACYVRFKPRWNHHGISDGISCRTLLCARWPPSLSSDAENIPGLFLKSSK